MSIFKFFAGLLGFIVLFPFSLVAIDELVPAEHKDDVGVVLIIVSAIACGYIIYKHLRKRPGTTSNFQPTSSKTKPENIKQRYYSDYKQGKQYKNPSIDRIRYVRITFRNWNRNMECFDITYELSSPKYFDRSGEFSLYPSGSYVFMIDSSFMVDKDLEKYKVSFLDSNKQELKDYHFSYYFDEFPNGEFANLVIH